jgi:hypothetical protein
VSGRVVRWAFIISHDRSDICESATPPFTDSDPPSWLARDPVPLLGNSTDSVITKFTYRFCEVLLAI